MKLIDPHIHMSVRTTDDYEEMKKKGFRCIVEPAFWSGSDKQYAESFLDYFNHMLTFEHARAKKYGLHYYAFVCINAKEARNKIAREVVERMESFLKHPACLGVGEVGLDMITPEEIEICKKQVQLAEKHKTLCIIHTPHINKRVGVEKLFEILKEEKVDMKRYVMDHNTDETIAISKSYPDIYIGITLYPTKMNIEKTAKIIKEYGAERIMLNSSADWGKSYPLMVAEAAEKLKDYGISHEDITKVTYQNAHDFFSQSPKFTIDEGYEGRK
jgi:uncharacterized protein